MAFVVEVSGEAAPLTSEHVYLALQSAASSQQLSIQTGTQQLQTWETQRGYYALLQSAYLDKSLPSEIRYLAIIQLKNGIDKYWRKTATNAITAEEKAFIRSQLLEAGVGEEETNIALQNALVVSKIVRIDYPQEWPEALTSMIKLLRSANHSNQQHLKRGMLMLLQIVKEMANAKLRSSQTRFISVTPELVFLLNEIYTEKVTIWLQLLKGHGEDEAGIMDAMKSSLFALKILRWLLIAGYEYPNHSSDVRSLWENSRLQFGHFLDLVTCNPPVLLSSAKDLVEKHVLQFSKLHVAMANRHPTAFALLPSSLDLVRAYWDLVTKFGQAYGSDTKDFGGQTLSGDQSLKNERPAFDQLCLKGLNVMRACVKMAFNPSQSFKYKSPEFKAEQAQAVELIKTHLLTDSLIQQIASTIVTKFFVFRQADLEAWDEDPVEWEIKEEGGGDTWEFEVRPCSEKLFMDVVIDYKNLLLEPLLLYFNSVSGTEQASLVTKDAVYTAMGLSAPAVFQSFDFDLFLTSTLVHDVQQTGPGYKVLRRRIAILLGQWIVVKISAQSRLFVYQIFGHLLKSEDETNDYVVRVTAAKQFKHVVDDFSFDSEQFVPYGPEILGKILSLIQEAKNIETKMAILDTIRSISNRLESHITPFADQIVSMLSNLWEAAREEFLLKQSILSVLSALISSLQTASERYYPLVLPLIANAVAPDSQSQLCLLEEALELWGTIVAQSPSPAPPGILALVDSAFPLLELGSQELRSVLAIFESYCLLAPEHLLSDPYRLRILSYMTSLLGLTKRELAGLVTTIVEILIRSAESLGGIQGVSQIAKDLRECGYLEQVFAGLRDAWEAHETVGPEKKYPKLDDVVETDYFTILARLVVADPGVFIHILSSFGSVDELWSWLSTEWFRHFDCMANVERQKLSCLALSRMLEVPPPTLSIVLAKLQDYFAMWTAVIGELIGGSEDSLDCLVRKSDEGYDGEVAELARRRKWSGTDLVFKVSTWDFVKIRLANVADTCGGQTRFTEEWLANVDTDVLKGYQALGINETSRPFWN